MMGEKGSGEEELIYSMPMPSQQDESVAIFWTFVAFASGIFVIRLLPYGIRLFS